MGTASSASRRADLAVSDLAEPPQFGTAGSRFSESFSVANQGARTARKKTSTRFFLDLNPNNSAGRRRLGSTSIPRLSGNGEETKRVRLRIPASLANGEYFLVACADTGKKLKEAKEANNCRVSGQTIAVGAGSAQGAQGPPGINNEVILPRTTLPIGRPTVEGADEPTDRPGDDEKSTQRAQLAKVGPISLVADCKRSTNGETFQNGNPPEDSEPDDPFVEPNSFDEDGDEAKILVYTDSGTVTFDGPGASSRRNIPPGEGASEPDEDSNDYTQAEESDGGEGAHMAIAAARDPDQEDPERDWAFAYKVHTVYINHSNGTEFVFTGYAAIDVLGAEDQCIFSGVLKTIKAVG